MAVRDNLHNYKLTHTHTRTQMIQLSTAEQQSQIVSPSWDAAVAAAATRRGGTLKEGGGQMFR